LIKHQLARQDTGSAVRKNEEKNVILQVKVTGSAHRKRKKTPFVFYQNT